MIKREAEKETPEDLKQAFRVFDKVQHSTWYSIAIELNKHLGWERIRIDLWNQIRFEQVRIIKKKRNFKSKSQL